MVQSHRHPSALVAGVGVGVEVITVVLAAGWAGARAALGHTDAPLTAFGLALFALVIAVGLAGAGWAAVKRGSGVGRAVVITWQLIQIGSAGTIIGASAKGPTLAVAWFAVVGAVAVVGAMIALARTSPIEGHPG